MHSFTSVKHAFTENAQMSQFLNCEILEIYLNEKLITTFSTITNKTGHTVKPNK